MQVERTQRIYCFGDSHCLPLENVILRSPQDNIPFFICSNYKEGLSAHNFDQDKLLHKNEPTAQDDKILSILKELYLINDDQKKWWLGEDISNYHRAVNAGTPAAVPLIIIFCGDIDLRGSIFKQFQQEFDFDLPNCNWEDTVGAKKLPLREVEELLIAKFQPIVDGVSSLHRLGFAETYISMLPLPSMENEETFKKAHGFYCPLGMRKKLTKLANIVLGRLCSTAVIPFLDVSSTIENDGLLHPKYYLDGIHMSVEAGKEIIKEAINTYYDRSPRAVSLFYYKHAMENAMPASHEEEKTYITNRKEFQKYPLISTLTDCDNISNLTKNLLVEDTTENNFFQFSWYNTPAAGISPYLRTTKLDPELIEVIYDYVYSEHNITLFQAAIGTDFHITAARIIRSIPHATEGIGPQSFHHDGTPPGLLRAVLYLCDVDEETGPFEYKNSEGKTCKMIGKEGTLLIFNANDIMHRGSAPTTKERLVLDLVIAPRPIDFLRRVAATSLNPYPLDPYQYATKGCTAYPAFERDWFQYNPYHSK